MYWNDLFSSIYLDLESRNKDFFEMRILFPRKKNMVVILQLLVSILILLSFALVVGVPVILVSPGEWEKSKGVVYTGAGLWFGLVIITAAFNSFII